VLVALDRQPTLESELLLLRPLTTADFEALYSIASDPLVWEQHPSKDRAQRPVFQQWFADALASGGALVCVDKREERIIGSSRFARRADTDEVEIGWTFLDRSHWGGTYNGEMKRLMLDHAFGSVGTVVFVVHTGNLRSQRAVEKLGAVRVGVAPDEYGRGENVIFQLDKGRWIDRP
jgi:RimJ/RimL family protein N-acetyltransferase